MPDREKVKKGLKHCLSYDNQGDKFGGVGKCGGCVYYGNDCTRRIKEDAFSVIEEQEEFRRIMFNRCFALTGKESCDICRFQKECFRERSLKPV